MFDMWNLLFNLDNLPDFSSDSDKEQNKDTIVDGKFQSCSEYNLTMCYKMSWIEFKLVL